MSQQLITFQIGEQYLGVDIMAVREIRAWSPTTRLPNAPPYVCGVVNLRGTVLPVIDLSALLGWGEIDPTSRHVIIVIRIRDQLQGMIVDAVNDIVTVVEETMQPAPNLGGDKASAFLEGLISYEDRMVMVLALEQLMPEKIALFQAEAA